MSRVAIQDSILGLVLFKRFIIYFYVFVNEQLINLLMILKGEVLSTLPKDYKRVAKHWHRIHREVRSTPCLSLPKKEAFG